MFENGTQRMDQVEDWSGTSVPQEEDSSQLEWCPALDQKPEYPQPLKEMEVVTPVVKKGISLVADDDGERI